LTQQLPIQENIRFSHHQESILLELACRRHVYERHITHFWEHITTRKTAGPENLMFKKLQTSWNVVKDDISVDQYVRLDLNGIKGTFLETQVKETVEYCKLAMSTDVFSRGDYLELLELTLVYLCPEVNTTIQAPGSVSHARFMAKAIYFLKLPILSAQLPYSLTAGQKKEVKRMSEFVYIFYTVWFLW